MLKALYSRRCKWIYHYFYSTTGLFTPGKDFLIASNGEEMKRHLSNLLQDEDMVQELAHHGRQTILQKHTCTHRVDELLEIYAELESPEAVTV